MFHWLWLLAALQVGVILGLLMSAMFAISQGHPWEDEPRDFNKESP